MNLNRDIPPGTMISLGQLRLELKQTVLQRMREKDTIRRAFLSGRCEWLIGQMQPQRRTVIECQKVELTTVPWKLRPILECHNGKPLTIAEVRTALQSKGINIARTTLFTYLSKLIQLQFISREKGKTQRLHKNGSAETNQRCR